MTRRAEKNFVASAFFAMLAWEVYAELFATRAALDYIHLYHVDKVFHIIGGAFVVAVIFIFFGEPKLVRAVAVILAVSLVLEVGEVYFDRSVIYFFQKDKSLWLLDTLGDTLFAVIGALMYYYTARSES